MSNTVSNIVESLRTGTITLRTAASALVQHAGTHGIKVSESVARRTKGQFFETAEKVANEIAGKAAATASSTASDAVETHEATTKLLQAHDDADPGPGAVTREEMGQAVVDAANEMAESGVGELAVQAQGRKGRRVVGIQRAQREAAALDQSVAARASALLTGGAQVRPETAAEPKKARGESKFAFIVTLFDGRTVSSIVDAVCEKFPGSDRAWAIGYVRQVAYDVNTGYAKGYSHLEGKVVRTGRGTDATIAIAADTAKSA